LGILEVTVLAPPEATVLPGRTGDGVQAASVRPIMCSLAQTEHIVKNK